MSNSVFGLKRKTSKIKSFRVLVWLSDFSGSRNPVMVTASLCDAIDPLEFYHGSWFSEIGFSVSSVCIQEVLEVRNTCALGFTLHD
ncbi:hypothetical protein CEXT_672941 [Caerostris extrusa]|uniref:Uncharacterized protein n=1 Tax=Caerostris extrusa TaxID=172846 RepID=A0AAV4T385_CAEEX|nr:hypothetical protein CEXT_672941 [Caerostris extrusa]